MLRVVALFAYGPVPVVRPPVGLPLKAVRIEGTGIADRKGVVVRNGLRLVYAQKSGAASDKSR